MPPLAERLRPRTLDEYIGQKHLVGPGAVLRKMIDAGRISSFILWGPPGVGKTTLAQIIANKLETPFYTLSAVTSGVKDVRDVIERAKSNRFFSQASPILFIDEIHRFSKSQQDSLLGAVEQGTVTLIGATTENPSFEVIRPLLSRCQLYTLKSLEKDDLLELLQRAITTDTVLKERKIELKTSACLKKAEITLLDKEHSFRQVKSLLRGHMLTLPKESILLLRIPLKEKTSAATAYNHCCEQGKENRQNFAGLAG